MRTASLGDISATSSLDKVRLYELDPGMDNRVRRVFAAEVDVVVEVGPYTA